MKDALKVIAIVGAVGGVGWFIFLGWGVRYDACRMEGFGHQYCAQWAIPR